LSEEALLSCIAYVELNPIRASLFNTPEASDYTSINKRIALGFDLKIETDEQIKQQRLQRFDLPLKPLTILERRTINRQIEKLYASQCAKKRRTLKKTS
jgi:hypothetical protein